MLARSLFSILCLSLSSFSLADVIAKEYPVKDFSEFVAASGILVDISQTGEEYLRVEADESIFNTIKVDQTGKRVSIRVKHDWSISDWFKGNEHQDVRVILKVKNLDFLDLSGAVQAKVGDFTADKLRFNASGAAQADFASLNAVNLIVDLSGAANVNVQTVNSKEQYFGLSGAADIDIKSASSTQTLKANVSGASNMQAKNLTSQSADLDASGASHIELRVSEQLKAEASGASAINYYGSPKAQINSSGASHIGHSGE